LRGVLAFYKRRILRPLLHFSHLLRFAFCSAGTFYSFSLSERLTGARLAQRGYRHKPAIRISAENERLERVEIEGLRVFVPRNVFKEHELQLIHNEVFSPQSENPHVYETDFISIRAGDYVVDAGACEGFFSLYALHKGAERVYAFEPLEALREGLEKTFAAHGEGKIELVAKGLSDHCGTEKFSSVESLICASHFDEGGKELVETITLDDFVTAQTCPRIDFIKVDVEGAELRLLAGALETLKRFRPRLSIAVYHEYENAELIRKLIKEHVPDYTVRFGGSYMMEMPCRPFMLYAFCQEPRQANS